ncbi:hypothetical protein NC652_014290 [Populus alba x Populus x berolinensis]|nr:hypothetical protein NC652_014290 [Populus alba x Populus x berolinensis]
MKKNETTKQSQLSSTRLITSPDTCHSKKQTSNVSTTHIETRHYHIETRHYLELNYQGHKR